MEDIFARTAEAYKDERGARAFVAKELVNDTSRGARVGMYLDAMELAGKRVLDVGCGYGRDVALFSQRGADAYGCDVSPALLDEAMERYGEDLGYRLGLDDIRQVGPLPFYTEPGFDGVWCCSVLVHVPRAQMPGVLKRLWDAVAPGGWLFIISKEGAGERVMDNLGHGLERIMVYYDVRELRDVLEPLGAVTEFIEKGGDAVKIPTGDRLFSVKFRKV